MVHKTVLIAGSGKGLGRVTDEKLAVLGHRVVLMVRTSRAAEPASDEIRRHHRHVQVETRSVDLSELSRVRDFANSEVERADPIDKFFHVAGILQTSPSRRVTTDGYEETLAVNVLAPFLMTALLLPILECVERVVTRGPPESTGVGICPAARPDNVFQVQWPPRDRV